MSSEKTEGVDPKLSQDGVELAGLGYKPVLSRSFGLAEAFAASFCAMNFIGVSRTLLYIGLSTGGPAAMWSSCLIHVFGASISAAVLAELCSSLPISGSIYVWASEAAGRKYGRLVGFVVAWWAATAWVSFVASNSQAPAGFLLSLMKIFDYELKGGLTTESLHYRCILFAVTLGCMWIALGLNYLPPRWFAFTFRATIAVLLVDLLLSVIWLPVGVSRTYGFRSAHEVFATFQNETGGFPDGWAWVLSFYYAGYITCGYVRFDLWTHFQNNIVQDAAGHVAEETRNASLISARGIFWSAVASSVLGLAATVLWLFCIPPADVLYTLDAPQPFVQIWALSIGKGGATVMTVIAVAGLILSTSCAVTASSRLVFAIARDGILPFSKWISKANSVGQPKNAITAIFAMATVLLVISIPSQVAFYSLLSAGATTSISAYALIGACRLILTPNEFKHSRWSLGKWGPLCYTITCVYNTFLLTAMYSPLYLPITAETFNFAIVIMAYGNFLLHQLARANTLNSGISIFGILSWWFIPPEYWLRPELIQAMREHAVSVEHDQSSEGSDVGKV